MKSIRIELAKVTKIYKSNGASPIVKDIDLSIEEGTIVSLCGENGSGKTTILKMVCGLIEPTEGRILVNGYDLSSHRRQALEALGAVLEGNRSFHWQLTPKQNLEYFGVLRGLDYRFLHNQMKSLLHLMGLEGYKDVACKNLSRGFQQRVAIALALIADPPILLLDEPTLGLDDKSCTQTAELIRALGNHRGRTIFMATHNASFARSVSHNIIQVNKGRIVDIRSKTSHLPQPAFIERWNCSPLLENQNHKCSFISNLLEKEETYV